MGGGMLKIKRILLTVLLTLTFICVNIAGQDVLTTLKTNDNTITVYAAVKGGTGGYKSGSFKPSGGTGGYKSGSFSGSQSSQPNVSPNIGSSDSTRRSFIPIPIPIPWGGGHTNIGGTSIFSSFIVLGILILAIYLIYKFLRRR